jgi:undecaprenyl-diphosphatase
MIFHLSPTADMAITAIDRIGTKLALLANTPLATTFMKVISGIFDPMIVLLASCAFVAILLVRKLHFEAMRFLISILTISALVWIVKHLVVRLRPVDSLIAETGFSFPSGHAAVSVVFFYILYMTIKPYIQSLALRRICFAIALIMPLLIGWSRVYLGVHYLSDVLGGFIFGAMVVSIAILISHSHAKISRDEFISTP